MGDLVNESGKFFGRLAICAWLGGHCCSHSPSRSAHASLKRYGELRGERARWVLIEATDRLLPEIDEGLAQYAQRRLTRRGIDIRMGTSLESAEGGIMRLSSGEEFAATTLVWTTGVRPHALAARSGFPVDDRGRVTCDEYLRVHDAGGGVVPDAWAAGDNAAVPDLTTGGLCPPTAQHAIRQAKQLAANVVASTRGRAPQPFRYHNRGQLVSLGRYRGVARLPGRIRVRGFAAWWLHRTYHLATAMSRTHFRSPGTIHQGAMSVDVSVIASSYAD